MKLNFKRTHRYDVSSKGLFVVPIYTLQNVTLEYTVSSSTTGRDALEFIAQRLEIDDVSYFGFRYESWHDEYRWLFLNKSIKKQLDKYARQHSLLFGVMFFIENPQFIPRDVIRRQFYYQLLHEVMSGTINMTTKQAIKLGAYALQSEYGDFIDCETTFEKWRERPLVHESCLKGAQDLETVEHAEDILWGYRHLQGVSQTNAQWYFIDEVRKRSNYGVQVFKGSTRKNTGSELGVSRNGISIWDVNASDPKEKYSIANLRWEEIKDLAYSRKTFTIQRLRKSRPIQFLLPDKDKACYLWQYCIQIHGFYINYWTRLRTSPPQVIMQVPEPPDIIRGVSTNRVSPRATSSQSCTSEGSGIETNPASYPSGHSNSMSNQPNQNQQWSLPVSHDFQSHTLPHQKPPHLQHTTSHNHIDYSTNKSLLNLTNQRLYQHHTANSSMESATTPPPTYGFPHGSAPLSTRFPSPVQPSIPAYYNPPIQVSPVQPPAGIDYFMCPSNSREEFLSNIARHLFPSQPGPSVEPQQTPNNSAQPTVSVNSPGEISITMKPPGVVKETQTTNTELASLDVLESYPDETTLKVEECRNRTTQQSLSKMLLSNPDIHQLLSLTNMQETELSHRLLAEYRQTLRQQQSFHSNSVSTPNLTARELFDAAPQPNQLLFLNHYYQHQTQTNALHNKSGSKSSHIKRAKASKHAKLKTSQTQNDSFSDNDYVNASVIFESALKHAARANISHLGSEQSGPPSSSPTNHQANFSTSTGHMTSSSTSSGADSNATFRVNCEYLSPTIQSSSRASDSLDVFPKRYFKRSETGMPVSRSEHDAFLYNKSELPLSRSDHESIANNQSASRSDQESSLASSVNVSGNCVAGIGNCANLGGMSLSQSEHEGAARWLDLNDKENKSRSGKHLTAYRITTSDICRHMAARKYSHESYDERLMQVDDDNDDDDGAGSLHEYILQQPEEMHHSVMMDPMNYSRLLSPPANSHQSPSSNMATRGRPAINITNHSNSTNRSSNSSSSSCYTASSKNSQLASGNNAIFQQKKRVKTRSQSDTGLLAPLGATSSTSGEHQRPEDTKNSISGSSISAGMTPVVQRTNPLFNNSGGLINRQLKKDWFDSPTQYFSKDYKRIEIAQRLSDWKLLSNEFDSLPLRSAHATCYIANSPENQVRNRSSQSVPYDHSRVKLQPTNENKSGYINAAHIKVDLEKSGRRLQLWLVTTQLPLSNTVSDFWALVWQSNISVLALLTSWSNSTANYLPTEKSPLLEVQEFIIRFQWRKLCSSYEQVCVEIQHVNKNRCRSVYHFQFLNWTADNEVPANVAQFADYLEDLTALNRHLITGEHTTSNLTSGQSFRSTSSIASAVIPTSLPCAPGYESPVSSSSNSSGLQNVPEASGSSSTTRPLLLICRTGNGPCGIAALYLLMRLVLEHNLAQCRLGLNDLLASLRSNSMQGLIQNVHQYAFVYRALLHYFDKTRLI